MVTIKILDVQNTWGEVYHFYVNFSNNSDLNLYIRGYVGYDNSLRFTHFHDDTAIEIESLAVWAVWIATKKEWFIEQIKSFRCE